MTADSITLEGHAPLRPISLHDTPTIRPMLPRPSNRIRKRFASGSVAQSVEQRPFKALVPGSSPGRPNFFVNARQKSLPLIAAVIAASSLAPAADFDLVAQATNKIAVDLYRQLATGDENLCLSPYSIQSALAMTFAGADGETRNEMARVLHFKARTTRSTRHSMRYGIR
jgi:hypothetical protein